MKAKTFVVNWSIYPFDVLVTTASNDYVIKRIERTVHELAIEDRELLGLRGQEDGRTVMLQGGQLIIQLRYPPVDPATIAHCVHEVFHAVDFLFRHIGIKLSDKSDEAYAYAIQYLTQRILEQFKRKPRKK